MPNKPRKSFQFDLITPDEIIISEEASMVLVPGELGEFGVLANHSALISSVKPGVVSLFSVTGGVRKFFVSYGLADVNELMCSVLVENVTDLGTITIEEAEAELKELERKARAISLDNDEAHRILEDLLGAVAKLRAVQDLKGLNQKL